MTTKLSSDSIPHILIAEDEPDLLRIYQMILTFQGYRVSIAKNGIEAMKVLRDSTKDSRPDMLLLDIFMPIMDGREFLKNLDTSHYPDLKIVVSSNLSDKETIDEMLALGAHDYVLKASLSPNDLLTLVDKTLNND